MGITEETYLPTEEELTVQEINLSGPALTAASVHIGKACEYQNNVRLLLPNHLSNVIEYAFRSSCCAERSLAILEHALMRERRSPAVRWTSCAK